jgi:hypothetical protein
VEGGARGVPAAVGAWRGGGWADRRSSRAAARGGSPLRKPVAAPRVNLTSPGALTAGRR